MQLLRRRRKLTVKEQLERLPDADIRIVSRKLVR